MNFEHWTIDVFLRLYTTKDEDSVRIVQLHSERVEWNGTAKKIYEYM